MTKNIHQVDTSTDFDSIFGPAPTATANDLRALKVESLDGHTPAMTVCESGWTGDRCTFALDHDGDHSNE